MSIEQPEKPKNPWAGGAEREQQLGIEEVQKIRDEVAARGSTEYVPISTGGRTVEAAEREQQERFRNELKEAGGHLEETFELDDAGRIRVDFERDNLATSFLDVVEGIRDVRPTADDGRPGKQFEIVYLPEALLRSARNISEKFPDMHFSFRDDRPKKFSYSVTLTETHA